MIRYQHNPSTGPKSKFKAQADTFAYLKKQIDELTKQNAVLRAELALERRKGQKGKAA